MLRNTRKLGSAMVLAGMIAGGMMLGSTNVEAKKSRPDPHDAICEYLASVINYSYASQAIKDVAISLFNAYNCDPTLLQ